MAHIPHHLSHANSESLIRSVLPLENLGLLGQLGYPGAEIFNVMWLKHVKTRLNHPFGNGTTTTYSNGDLGDGLYDCFTFRLLIKQNILEQHVRVPTFIFQTFFNCRNFVRKTHERTFPPSEQRDTRHPGVGSAAVSCPGAFWVKTQGDHIMRSLILHVFKEISITGSLSFRWFHGKSPIVRWVMTLGVATDETGRNGVNMGLVCDYNPP